MTSGIDLSKNLEEAESFIRKAAMEGCNLVCLPETFALMPRGRQDVLVFAENYGEGPIQARISSLAKNLGLWIIAGSIALFSDKKITSPTLVWFMTRMGPSLAATTRFTYFPTTRKKNDTMKAPFTHRVTKPKASFFL